MFCVNARQDFFVLLRNPQSIRRFFGFKFAYRIKNLTHTGRTGYLRFDGSLQDLE